MGGSQTGVEVRGNFLTGHKFTNLLKSVSPCRLLDRGKVAFPHSKGKLTLLEKNIKFKLTLIKKGQKMYTSHIFFFVRGACTAILSLSWKNNNTIFTVSGIQTIRKLNNPTTILFAGLILIVVRFNLLRW